MKKRFLALLLVLTMVFSLMPAALAADTLSGSGTEDDPYLLATAADLKAFRDMANAEASSKLCATLTADIDLGGEAWTPFEPSSGYVSQAYAGTFDGANHTIKGLSVNLTSSTGAGLFGTVCGATIKNLRVEGNVSASSSVSVGGIVGRTQTSATIDSCSFAGTVTSTKKNGAAGTAGIVGRVNAGTLAVTNCANLSDVTGSGSAAGILGYAGNTKVTIENCYNSGAISGQNYASGICSIGTGKNGKTGKIGNCYNVGTITGTSDGAYYAGISANFQGAISNSYYAAPVEEKLMSNATATATAITSPDGLADKLGNAFKEDTAGANNGYPILVWQAGEVVQPDPRIELTGPATLWRTNTEPQPQVTITAACKDMDKDTHVNWTLTEGEGIVTLETPEGAGAANQSVIVKATADGAGKAVITASTANGITASLTIYVIPQITAVELEGVVAVGETVRAKINVLGGGEYDYENFPKLKIEWRYLTAADYNAGKTGTSSYKEITGTTGREYTIPEDMAGNYLSFLLYDTVSREYKTLSSPVRIATAEERLLKADASALTLDTSDIRAATTLTLPAAGSVNGSAITWASSDSSIIDPATGAVTLPASGIQTVTLSATLTRGEATAYRNFDIRVWSQAELALMAQVKAHYFDGIRNANTDEKNILTDLHPFQEAYLDADGQLVWVYDHADLTGSGIVPVAMDGWSESEQWRLFRSSNSHVISHENLLVTRPAEDKTVTIRSELSSETLGKYAARYPDNADFQALSHQAVSAKVTVVGTTPVDPTPVDPTPIDPTPVDPTPVDPNPETITVTFQLHTDTEAWILPTVVRDLPEGTTAFDVFKQVLAANGYTYDAKGSYVQAVTAPDGTKVAELSKGQYSGWMYRVNGEFPDTYMGAYELEDGDGIEVFFTADYTKEAGAFLPFVDVTNHWAYTDIKRVYNRGWMVGESATIFAPDQELTRAMLAVILYAMAGEPEVAAANPFSDVPAGEWYTDAIIWAAANGIVVGCGDGTFRPEMAVTRAQAAVMLCGYAAFAGRDVTARTDLSAFGDAADIPAWAQAEMQWANAEKLILGRDGKLLAPNAAATRAEMASILSGYAAA